MWTEPAELLAKHGYLLEEDVELLGEGLSGGRYLWIAPMDYAMEADYIRSGRSFMDSTGNFETTSDYSTALRPSRTGSFVYKQHEKCINYTVQLNQV